MLSIEGSLEGNRLAADQAGRDEIQTLGRLFADEALLAAAVSAGLVGGLQSLFNHFEMLGQRAAHRLIGDALLNVGIDDDVLSRSRLLLCEHFVDQGQLLIFNG